MAKAIHKLLPHLILKRRKAQRLLVVAQRRIAKKRNRQHRLRLAVTAYRRGMSQKRVYDVYGIERQWLRRFLLRHGIHVRSMQESARRTKHWNRRRRNRLGQFIDGSPYR